MKRTKIQKIIIPRNWLFGRLAFIYENLRNLRLNNKMHFTELELKTLNEAELNILSVLKNKKI